MTDFKIGPLPKVRYVRKTIKLTEELDAELEGYAHAHGERYEPVEAEELIPHSIAHHLATDRGWRAWKARQARTGKRQPPASGAAKAAPETPPPADE